jgi:hypothetical protein
MKRQRPEIQLPEELRLMNATSLAKALDISEDAVRDLWGPPRPPVRRRHRGRAAPEAVHVSRRPTSVHRTPQGLDAARGLIGAGTGKRGLSDNARTFAAPPLSLGILRDCWSRGGLRSNAVVDLLQEAEDVVSGVSGEDDFAVDWHASRLGGCAAFSVCSTR